MNTAGAEPLGHGEKVAEKNSVVYQRFYHMFVKGETESLMELAGGNNVVEIYYDKENWCVIAEKV